MNNKFFDLSKEKQDRMINGALQIYGCNGYKHASTDDMVKAVGVSKGLWFHYFENKIGLYSFVYDYSVKYMLMELTSLIADKEKDYYEIVKQIVFTTMRVMKSYPYFPLFLKSAMQEQDAEAIEATKESRDKFLAKLDSLLKNAQMDAVMERAERQQMRSLVRYAISGILDDHYGKQDLNTDKIYEEIISYVTLLRTFSRKNHEILLENDEAV